MLKEIWTTSATETHKKFICVGKINFRTGIISGQARARNKRREVINSHSAFPELQGPEVRISRTVQDPNEKQLMTNMDVPSNHYTVFDAGCRVQSLHAVLNLAFSSCTL
jgi:hypothetical protein